MSELRAGPGLRIIRGLIAAGIAAGLGMVAHVGAGGLLPSLPWLVVMVTGLAFVAIGALGTPAGLLRLIALVAGGQFFTHVMLTVVPPESWRASLCGFPAGGRCVLVVDRAHHARRAVPAFVVVEPVAPVQHDRLGLAGVGELVA